MSPLPFQAEAPILDVTAQRSGLSYPVGATVRPGGVNFCVFSKHATAVSLLLYASPEAPKPALTIPLDPILNKTNFYWHTFIPGLEPGQVYGYRAYGPHEPEQGLRFDEHKVLLDPYARAIANADNYKRLDAIKPGDNSATALRSVVVDPKQYDWGEDTPLRIPYADTVIYEMHVGGFTRNPNSGLAPELRGTYAGVVEKIPYLKSLGVTAVELMPVFHYDEHDAREGLPNYWGYSTIAFMAPHARYSSRKEPLGAVNEFRDMVKALHKEGIEVILDVVFNHTAEGNEYGPTLSFKGWDNPIYYILDEEPQHYKDYSGCGNSFNVNHPITGRLLIECLRYWVSEMHVDGFRFDLASALTRDVKGNPEEVGVLWTVDTDPFLAGTKLIAEPWDSSGLYQVGDFVYHRDWFAEWNGPFRDDVRGYVKGTAGSVKTLGARLLGSPDIYKKLSREPSRSINFITCHDGFTLNDLVSYDEKHNEENGEDSRDGANFNQSWNCGVEGPTDDAEVNSLRLKQVKNFLTVLFVSQGTPMILMGDEVRRTQNGNNNAYCQDNALSWFDWSLVDKNAHLLHFTCELIAWSQSLRLFRQTQLLATEPCDNAHIIWHGVELNAPDWGAGSHSIAFELVEPEAGERLYIALNAYWEELIFHLPAPAPGCKWHRIVDTNLEHGCILHRGNSPEHESTTYTVAARSSVILMALPLVSTRG
ncbi:MAG TPA: glycogen debranching protein GlgX [Planktothrix sp.]|jgi:glycogen operon protein